MAMEDIQQIAALGSAEDSFLGGDNGGPGECRSGER